jgi:hypothetical protein
MSRAFTALERYLALCEAMLGTAQAGEWDDLVRVGAERDSLAAELFADPAAKWPAAEQASARTLIERCQQLDAQIRSLAEERQKSLRVLLRVADPLT